MNQSSITGGVSQMVNIKLLFVILNNVKDKQMKSLFNKHNISVQCVTHGLGTASPSVLDYFGLSETKKSVYFAIIPNYLESKILSQINKNFNIESPGTGVAFTVPISSSNKYLSTVFEKNKEKEVEMFMENEERYHLIITIVLEGHLEQVMNAAKRVGATGGTVIRGRGLGNKEAIKFLGLELEPEREVVLNIVEEKIKTKVMEEITNAVGIKTKGKGICISLPIDAAIGFKDK